MNRVVILCTTGSMDVAGYAKNNIYICFVLICGELFSGIRVNRSLVLGVMFCRSLFVLFFFLPLWCLFFFDLRPLITPLIS